MTTIYWAYQHYGSGVSDGFISERECIEHAEDGLDKGDEYRVFSYRFDGDDVIEISSASYTVEAPERSAYDEHSVWYKGGVL